LEAKLQHLETNFNLLNSNKNFKTQHVRQSKFDVKQKKKKKKKKNQQIKPIET
jgi:hypothetical protein